ncbi:MAG: orotidine-5'-phosphate decarboxylase [Candidatus Margulisiibacteriota bacterium]|nr:MAG: orotidine 5'-phosphate decarboxylase [Candidatus Margulisbacteria bacterium GWD2_39_127]OGI03121.1 MAG: orotidine 5'-phosphate decarboxylase [Candidatus Margulisbacteria bacterium GWF2_38_17]OGI11676.1 MAG: orotidine 5'-phosphate decarboxylase [Candidatus Margulisbacteria bacterium GWE2_39_32]PZM83778.1 MAG: orotidine-5'-phosphate decarboxylase [Candidatus Margulisiibacteriota bacterium]HAR63030.1 orotidine-5'-phosphate decarboxylase [Candidatus Margulisiibacteriota bacterium]
MNFQEKLRGSETKNNSKLCVGLDIDPQKIPLILRKEKSPILFFNKAIIDATKDLVCAYKPNMAFYESLGVEGLALLKETLSYIPQNIPVILDAKRGDIGNTAAMYAKAIFEDLKADATTLHPYMGYDSVQPFLDYSDKMSFVLCVTSNKGSIDFQKQKVGDQYLYELVATKCKEWNKSGNVGLVIGATNPEELKKVRELCPGMIFLVPGIGAQGGSLEDAVRYGLMYNSNIVINSSREILYASSESDFAQKARNKAQDVRDRINSLI